MAKEALAVAKARYNEALARQVRLKDEAETAERATGAEDARCCP